MGLKAVIAGSSSGASTVVIADDTSTNATVYPTWVTASSGTLPLKVSSTKITFNPSTGLLTGVGLATSSANSWAQNQYFTETTLTSSSNSIAWNLNTNMNAKVTMTENTTLAAPSNLVSGKTALIKFVQAAGPYTLAFNGTIKWAGGLAPSISTGNGAIDIFSFFTDGTNVYGSVYGQNFS